ncbi:MAG TPA: response regulator [Burkholderiales bacterium]|nr:response regulator [Burkholderiales bacterium]
MSTPEQAREDPVNVLIVDDLPEKLLAYRMVLEELGENLVTARSGSEALREVLSREFAVILLDVNMPDIDGMETARMIRRYGASAHTPIIFITAYADEIQMARGYSLGAVDYILSPVVPDVLRTKVKVFCELARLQRRTRAHAEERVALAQEQAARAAAEEANRRKDEFLAMLSHELRNPLAPIRNAVEVMRRVAPADARLDWAREAIDRQVTHMTQLVDGLLDVSRITRGKIKLKKEPVDLGKVLEQAIESTRPLLDARRHRLTAALGGPVRLSGDFGRLTQVFVNLLANAAKYTPEGGAVHVSLTAGDGEAIVSVRDNGAGIERELLPRVFDIFVQGERSLDRSPAGLGIGLTIVHHLVTAHGGRVEAASEGPGRGAEFVVALPCLRQVPEADAPPTTMSAAGEPPARRRVLVVDDNADVAESIAVFLRLVGHEVRIASDGAQAIALAQLFAPEVAILDIGLPGMSGYELARRLQSLPETRGALLVAVSGYGQKDDRVQASAAGFQHHFLKPSDPAEILRVVARASPDPKRLATSPS